MKPIAVIDVETDPFKRFRSPKPFLAGFFDGKRVRTFWGRHCIRDCWKAVRRELRGYYIYWHNGGKFDGRYFMPHLMEEDASLFPIKGRMAKFKMEDGTEFRDSFCLLPVSLKQAGKKDIDYRKMEAGVRDRHKAEILDYWKTDLYALHEKVAAFVQEYGFGLTMAGRTFDVLKKRFAMVPPKADAIYDERLRRFYYGGRVQFFKLGPCKGTYTVLDINSAYPAAMLKKHAWSRDFRSTTKLPKNESTLQTSFIRFRGRCDGGLPSRLLDGSLSFGPASGEFFVTGWEFLAAKKAGAVHVVEIIECLVPQEARDFGEFVNHFYRQKRQAAKGSSEELFAKLFLNSAYGRFALNPREFRDVVMVRIKDEPDENKEFRKQIKDLVRSRKDEPDENKEFRKQIKDLVRSRHPGIRGESFRDKCRDYWEGFEGKWTLANEFEDIGIGVWERPCEIKSGSFFNVATAASITGCVRAFLFESLRQCRGVAYCDTDSIIAESCAGLAIGPDLGQWKVEGTSAKDSLWIGGKKLYALKLQRADWKTADRPTGNPAEWEKVGGKWVHKWKIASKGVRLSPAEIIRVAKGETVKSTLEAPTFSLFTTRQIAGSKSDFISRTVRRDDLRERRKVV